ncbi:MAG TPA: hypothetical protein VHL98_06135 [Microvirga sp.]|jgi:hypothetical protein|nr:hypothetical protein [Microvirga sp.]
MRRTVATLAFTAVLAAAAASFAGLPGETRAGDRQREAVFLVPLNDGYGVAECLATGGECGQIVADAWCETHGYARATSFGPVAPEDVTGSVQRASTARAAERPVAVTCGM